MPPDDKAVKRQGSPMSTFRLGIDIGGTYINALDATCRLP